MRRHARCLVLGDVISVVAADDRPVARADDFKHLSRKGADIDAVAGDDNVINRELRHVFNNGFQRRQVTVNISQDCQAGHISTSLNRS